MSQRNFRNIATIVKAIEYMVFKRGRPFVFGCSNKEDWLVILRSKFPEADVSIVNDGIKVERKKSYEPV